MLSPASWQSGGRRQHSNSEPGLKQDLDFDWLLTSVGEQAWFWLIAFICWWSLSSVGEQVWFWLIAFICWWSLSSVGEQVWFWLIAFICWWAGSLHSTNCSCDSEGVTVAFPWHVLNSRQSGALAMLFGYAAGTRQSWCHLSARSVCTVKPCTCHSKPRMFIQSSRVCWAVLVFP